MPLLIWRLRKVHQSMYCLLAFPGVSSVQYSIFFNMSLGTKRSGNFTPGQFLALFVRAWRESLLTALLVWSGGLFPPIAVAVTEFWLFVVSTRSTSRLASLILSSLRHSRTSSSKSAGGFSCTVWIHCRLYQSFYNFFTIFFLRPPRGVCEAHLH